jgi:hypothetical protein
MQKILLSILIILILCLSLASAATTWPNTISNTINSDLSVGYEPSGAVWHYGLQQLILVGDDGDVTIMDRDGNNAQTQSPGGDLEGVTIVDRQGDLIYLMQEHPAKIIEYSIEDKKVTGKSWDIQDDLGYSNSKYGAEAITYLPEGYHQFPIENGVFAIGLQENGKIYFFDINLDVSNNFELLGSILPDSSIIFDISGLDFNIESNTLYAIYDGYNILLELQLENNEWEVKESIQLTGSNQEGITLEPTSSSYGSIYIAQDSGEVYRYDNFPGTFPTFDIDSDKDKLTDHEELVYGTDLSLSDTDGDTFTDWQEIIKHDTDPLDIDDRQPEKMLSYSLNSDSTISISYASGRTYIVTPFEGDFINYYWPNRNGRTLFVVNEFEGLRIQNGEVVSDFNYWAQTIETLTLDTDSSFTVTYDNGDSATIDPFNGEDIKYIWTNSANKVVYVFSGEVVYAYKNGIKFKEVSPKYLSNYLERLITRYGPLNETI